MGDAISVDLEMQFATGRLYAEGSLAEVMKEITGGSASAAVKYIKDAAQTLMFGSGTRTRTVNGKPIISRVTSLNDIANYVGFAFYAPDKIDGVKKFTAVLVKKVMFAPPSMAYRTKDTNLAFQTPKTTGEFLADDTDGKDLVEVAVCDTADDARAWINAVLNASAAAMPVANPAAGAVASGTEIALTSETSGASIYYTLDGSAPSAASTLYADLSKPTIAAPLTLKAIAVKAGMVNSEVLTAAYTVTGA
jgi:hypothetical protein